jgi:hypothetical protein
MAGADFYTDRAQTKMAEYGLTKNDVEIALSSGEYRSSNVPGTEHKVGYIKSKGLMVGVVYKMESGGRRVIISCWGRKQ